MRQAGAILARTLEKLRQAMVPGVSTAELDALAEAELRAAGALPSFKGYNGYPATICVEIEDVVVHGIPRPDQRLQTGTIVGIDIGCSYKGWHADMALTVALGEVDEERRRLVAAAEEALRVALQHARAGSRLGELCRAVQEYVEQQGFAVVRALVGHGIGRQMHEPPQIPNFYAPGEFADYELVLRPGMTLAIEPMLAAGSGEVVSDEDGWTTRTADGRPAAHWEHTVLITKGEPEILTRPRD
jgi:methionyl aminopeptidase